MNKCPTCKPIISKTVVVCPEKSICLNPAPCSEILDSACFQYEGDNIILCNTNAVIVQKYDALELALQKIVDALCQFCNLEIAITPGTNVALTAVVTGGTAPYTYKWSIAQAPFVGHTINGSTTNSTLLLDCIPANGIETPTIDNFVKITNVFLTVTDAAGCVNTVYYYYSSTCYPQIVAPEVVYPPEIPSKLYAAAFETPLALSVMNFMDNPDYIPTCEELKNICCVDGYPDYGSAADEYRELRDCYLKKLNENILAEEYGNFYHSSLDLNTWLPGGLNDKIVYNKGGLQLYSNLKGCPECTLNYWNEFYSDNLSQVISVDIISLGSGIQDGVYNDVEFSSNLGGLYFTANLTVIGNVVTNIEIVKKGAKYTINEELTPIPGQLIDNGSGIVLPVFRVTTIKENRLVDILPTVTESIIHLPTIIYPDAIYTSGNPGEVFVYKDALGDQVIYGWDPIMQIWNVHLGSILGEGTLTNNRVLRDAHIKALNEVILAHAPFMSANEYFPFHRLRNEIF